LKELGMSKKEIYLYKAGFSECIETVTYGQVQKVSYREHKLQHYISVLLMQSLIFLGQTYSSHLVRPYIYPLHIILQHIVNINTQSKIITIALEPIP
jgi:hypothetical protein